MLIGGVDYSPYVDHTSVDASNNVVMHEDTLKFTLSLSGELPAPKSGQEVVWQRWNNVTLVEVNREFAGVISRVRETEDYSALTYECECRTYVKWFDRKLVTGFFQQQPAASYIGQIVSAYCPGFTTNNVYAPFTIVPQYANYQRPSNLVKLAVDQIGFGWYIDYYRDVHVFRVEDFRSPLPGNVLDVDNDRVNYGDLVIDDDGEQVYNRITVRGFKVRSKTPYTLTFVGDGSTNQWSLGYRFSSAKNDSACTVNGVNYPVVRDMLDGLPGQATDASKAYVHWTQHLLRFVNPPASGAIVQFTGYPLIDRFYTNQNSASVAEMKAIEADPYGDGVYEMAMTDKSLTQSTMDAVKAKVELALWKYAKKSTGSFTSYAQGWRAGQWFSMVSTRRGNGALDGNTRYYIHRVGKKWVQPFAGAPYMVHYTIEFSDTPYLLSYTRG